MLALCVIVLAVPSPRRPACPAHPRLLTDRILETNIGCIRTVARLAPWLTESLSEKLAGGGNARLEFAARPLTYQRFRQNAVLRSVMDRSWI